MCFTLKINLTNPSSRKEGNLLILTSKPNFQIALINHDSPSDLNVNKFTTTLSPYPR